MRRTTEELIAELAAELTPVRRLQPPTVRALLWLAAIAVPAAVGVALFADMPVFERRVSDPRLALELAATMLTGLTAVLAAFHLSLPDRSRAWALLPLPPLLAWIALAGWGCLSSLTVGRGPNGEGLHCLVFLLASSLPIGAALLWSLSKARPLDGGLVAAVGGLGAAGLSAVLLQFFHPFDVTIMDLALHLLAVMIVVSAASMAGRRAFA